MKNKITIGDATFYHGDCLDIMPTLKDKSVDLVVTDPPYLINYKTGHRKDKKHEFCSVIQGDDNPQLITESILLINHMLKDNTALYMFCSQDRVDFFKKEIEKTFKIKNMIVWIKNNWTAGDLKSQYGKQYEIIFLANKGNKPFNGKRITDVWDCRRMAGKFQEHQNQKPVALMELCIKNHSTVDNTIFDPFMGSGTTAIACYRTGRKFIGVEKEKKYFDIAVERYKREFRQLRLIDS
jgi:site-specific DNA-methyltransferase (adenine-specific)